MMSSIMEQRNVEPVPVKRIQGALASTPHASPRNDVSQNKQFWTLQIAGWAGYAFVVFLAIIHPQFDKENFDLYDQIANLFIEVMSGFCLSYLQWIIINRAVHFSFKNMLYISFLSATILGIFYNIIKLISFKFIIHDQLWNASWDMLEFGGWLLFSVSTLGGWTAIFFVMIYNNKLLREQEKLLRAQTATKDAQLQMLRYQINPHFMFNSLNAVSTLIYKKDNDKANEMLEKLCELFRYSLDTNGKTEASLLKELDLLDVYVSIEKTRFGDRLKVIKDICPDTLRCRLPSMLLQPLVENAIKYAIEPRKTQGCVTIRTKRVKDELIIEVIDDGEGVKSTDNHGFGIGIANTKARLDTMFNGHYTVNIIDNTPHGTTIYIALPFKRN